MKTQFAIVPDQTIMLNNKKKVRATHAGSLFQIVVVATFIDDVLMSKTIIVIYSKFLEGPLLLV